MRHQLLFEHRKQLINATRLTESITILPQGFLIRNMVLTPKAEKLLERGAIQQHELELFIAQTIHHPQQERQEG